MVARPSGVYARRRRRRERGGSVGARQQPASRQATAGGRAVWWWGRQAAGGRRAQRARTHPWQHSSVALSCRATPQRASYSKMSLRGLMKGTVRPNAQTVEYGSVVMEAGSAPWMVFRCRPEVVWCVRRASRKAMYNGGLCSVQQVQQVRVKGEREKVQSHGAARVHAGAQ